MKVKALDHQIKECLKKVSDEDLRFIGLRLSQRLGSDLGEALALIYERYPELNKILTQTNSSNDVYETVDVIDRYVQDLLSKKLPIAN